MKLLWLSRGLSQSSERWILCETSQHYATYTCLTMYWRRFSKQRRPYYVAMNSATAPGRIAKHEREKRQFGVAAYYDYCRHVLTREHYLRRVLGNTNADRWSLSCLSRQQRNGVECGRWRQMEDRKMPNQIWGNVISWKMHFPVRPPFLAHPCRESQMRHSSQLRP